MKILREVLATLLSSAVLLATSSNVAAMPMYEPPYQEADQAPLSATEIENIVSPIALYPDQLVAQILGAATYPDQVTAASNYVNSSGLKGDALMKGVDGQPWDPSVKALTQFPTVLDQMAKNLAWTSALGDAAYNQQKDVMTAIQKLRQEAKAAGNLKTTSEIKVVQESPQTIVIQPANPQVVYVPSYNPTVVYGTPYNPPGYSTAALVTTGLISFGVGMAIGATMNNNCCGSWGYYGGGWGCNWHVGNTVYRNNVYVSRSNTFYGNNRYRNNSYYNNGNRNNYNGGNRNNYNGGNNRNNNGSNNKAAWNSGNRNSGNTVNKGGNTVNINNNGGGNNRPNQGNNANNRPNGGANANNRPNGGANAGNRPGNNAAGNRPNAGAGNKADRGYGNRPQSSNTAISGYGKGGNTRADANRGRQSMGAAKPAAQSRPAGKPAGGGARKR
ncbi:MAG TPA: DUF3300 domain-containing protein [Candidatus Angelobacter sp.]|nr:DUF3300 domain-containing protein [Candidatus Angelobacter sp.]